MKFAFVVLIRGKLSPTTYIVSVTLDVEDHFRAFKNVA